MKLETKQKINAWFRKHKYARRVATIVFVMPFMVMACVEEAVLAGRREWRDSIATFWDEFW